MKRLLFVILFTLPACAEAPGEDVTGVLGGTPTVELPISGKKVCAAGVKWMENYKSGSRTKTTHTQPKPKYAADATLTVDGKKFELSGSGTSGFEKYGEEWKWSKYKKDKSIPKVLWGWGRDGTLTAITDPKIRDSYTRLTAVERYADCGDTLTLRAIKKGNTLELVDKNPTQGRNALMVAFAGFSGFFCLLFIPMGLLIFFVVRRSIRKQKAKEGES